MQTNITCPTCKSIYDVEPQHCSKCGYPFSGTNEEKSVFIGQQILKKGSVSDTKDKIKRARVILWIIGGLNILISIFTYTGFMLLIGIALGVAFIMFGFLTYRKPFISIIIPLILLSLSYIVAAIEDPNTIIQGIIFKIVILASLVYALIGIVQAEKIRKESDFLREQNYN